MKRIIALLASMSLLAGCASQTGTSTASSSTHDEEQVTKVSETEKEDAVETAEESDSYDPIDVYPDEDGTAVGITCDTMHTAFFDFVLNDWNFATAYGDLEASEGTIFLIDNITVKNTFGDDITMFDTDFATFYGEDGVSLPLTTDDHYADGMLKEEYELKDGKSITGDLVFEVPETLSEDDDLMLFYVEVYEDEEEGNAFYVVQNIGDTEEETE